MSESKPEIITSHAEYGAATGATEVAAAFPDQIKGKTIFVTGVATNGLGEATVLALAAHSPALLILASRTPSRIAEVVEKIKTAHPSVPVRSIALDLGSPDSIKAVAEDVNKTVGKIDILILNAALVRPNRYIDPLFNLDTSFSVNHLGHFYLTEMLMPSLEASAKSSPPMSTRVVVVSSLAQLASPIRFHDLNLEKDDEELPEEERPTPNPLLEAFTKEMDESGYRYFVAYGQSKTANTLYTIELAKRVKSKNIAAISLHPGSIQTNFDRQFGTEQADKMVAGIPAEFWKTRDQGAATTVVAALDPKLGEHSGVYLDDCQKGTLAPWASDEKVAARLWEVSEEYLKKAGY
ncbi:NAD(P)-binding protein [Aulographum hederae CBS 113979]|uniref:NAD(P)-binding protein n=1 Tax=Aulographum hederae CBS 113979 TaxID=1176131 RepID=A0A6G1H990_9PEZI|nr:NAD(P)-binding protein [Aulographum hederae CBS 113979]